MGWGPGSLILFLQIRSGLPLPQGIEWERLLPPVLDIGARSMLQNAWSWGWGEQGPGSDRDQPGPAAQAFGSLYSVWLFDFLSGCAAGMGDLSSPTRGQTHTPTVAAQSYPLDHQGSPRSLILELFCCLLATQHPQRRHFLLLCLCPRRRSRAILTLPGPRHPEGLCSFPHSEEGRASGQGLLSLPGSAGSWWESHTPPA